MPDLTIAKCPSCGRPSVSVVSEERCEDCEENARAEQDAAGDDVPSEGDDGPCWCGEPNPLYSDDLDETCAGSGTLYCYCGGDFCVCHHHGEVECGGCEDCADRGEDDDYPEHDDETPPEDA